MSRSALRSVILPIVNDLIPAVAPQSNALADALWKLIMAIKVPRQADGIRVVIVELPLGNSIPSEARSPAFSPTSRFPSMSFGCRRREILR